MSKMNLKVCDKCGATSDNRLVFHINIQRTATRNIGAATVASIDLCEQHLEVFIKDVNDMLDYKNNYPSDGEAT